MWVRQPFEPRYHPCNCISGLKVYDETRRHAAKKKQSKSSWKKKRGGEQGSGWGNCQIPYSYRRERVCVPSFTSNPER